MSAVFDATTFGAVFVTLFVIMDPLGSIPLFLGLTGGRTNKTRARLAGQAVLVSLLVISLFAVIGQQVLRFLGIGIPALQGAGGLLLLIVALELLTDRQDEPTAVRDVNVALVPLGTSPAPARSWPPSCSSSRPTGCRTSARSPSASWPSTSWSTSRCASAWGVVKESGIVLLTRIAGLLLSAIAVQLVAESVMGFIAEAG